MTAPTNVLNAVPEPMILVAVYGTLKRGLSNHHVMQGAHYLGCDCLHAITLYDLGPYPGAKLEESDGIDVEVFAVTRLQLAALDVLEEFNQQAPDQGMYNRLQFATRFGDAWVYIYNRTVNGLAAQRRGSWQPKQAHVLHTTIAE